MAVRILRYTLIAVSILAFAICMLLVETNRLANQPLAIQQSFKTTIKRGSSWSQVVKSLGAHQVINAPTLMRLYLVLKNTPAPKAREYRLAPGMRHKDVVKLISKGTIPTSPLIILKGHNKFTIQKRFAHASLMTKKEFYQWCHNPGFLDSQKIDASSCEGYLPPGEYRFAQQQRPKEMFKTMFALHHMRMEKLRLIVQNVPKVFDENHIMTLASMVEKEAIYSKEHGRIACVFYNRLAGAPKWRLQSDPTVIYAAKLVDPNFSGRLKTKHLRGFKHPYSTYSSFGLPPGPIASPSDSAIKAALQPEPCDDFFFVANNRGEHRFCENLGCHNKAVAKFQKN